MKLQDMLLRVSWRVGNCPSWGFAHKGRPAQNQGGLHIIGSFWLSRFQVNNEG